MTRLTYTTLALVAFSASLVNADDFHNVKSGMLLGIYATPNNGGMEVLGTIDGYSAQGRLFSGDVVLRTTVDGLTVYRTRTNFEMENAKIAIGPNREAAVEIFRPGVGLMYAWVEFTPIGGVNAYAIGEPVPCRAKFCLESEKPGARALFQQNNQRPMLNQPGNIVIPQTQLRPRPRPRPMPTVNDPARLFD